jgi:hypothetical protein
MPLHALVTLPKARMLLLSSAPWTRGDRAKLQQGLAKAGTNGSTRGQNKSSARANFRGCYDDGIRSANGHPRIQKRILIATRPQLPGSAALPFCLRLDSSPILLLIKPCPQRRLPEKKRKMVCRCAEHQISALHARTPGAGLLELGGPGKSWSCSAMPCCFSNAGRHSDSIDSQLWLMWRLRISTSRDSARVVPWCSRW